MGDASSLMNNNNNNNKKAGKLKEITNQGLLREFRPRLKKKLGQFLTPPYNKKNKNGFCLNHKASRSVDNYPIKIHTCNSLLSLLSGRGRRLCDSWGGGLGDCPHRGNDGSIILSTEMTHRPDFKKKLCPLR